MPYKDHTVQVNYQNDRKKRLRMEWLQANGPCVRCGSWEDLRVDHIDPALKVSHRIWTWSSERREAELVKCQVLCDICHKEKTVLDIRKILGNEHGGGREGVRGCSCRPCKDRRAATRREQRGSCENQR